MEYYPGELEVTLSEGRLKSKLRKSETNVAKLKEAWNKSNSLKIDCISNAEELLTLTNYTGVAEIQSGNGKTFTVTDFPIKWRVPVPAVISQILSDSNRSSVVIKALATAEPKHGEYKIMLLYEEGKRVMSSEIAVSKALYDELREYITKTHTITEFLRGGGSVLDVLFF